MRITFRTSTYAAVNIVVVACFLCCILFPFIPVEIADAQDIVVPIEAVIDGRSRLEFSSDSVRWLHLDFAAPGRHTPLDLPTRIDNQPWYPAWPDIPDQENRDCSCYSDSFFYSAPWGPGVTIKLQILEAREQVQIIQYPTIDNGGKLIIEFNDDMNSGYSWYRINLIVSSNSSSGLVLWNTLGSINEIRNSRVGPELEVYDRSIYGDGVQGTPGFIPGLFGQALVLDPGEHSVIGDRIRNVILGNANNYVNIEQGTVEVWYKQDKDPVPYLRNPYRIVDGAHGLNQCFTFHSLATDLAPDDPKLEMGFASNCGGDRITVSAPISQYNGKWIHLAGVWDRKGIQGTNETIQLYINGTKVGSTTETSWGNRLGKVLEIAGSNDIDSYRAFAVDNLAIWNQARTTFSLEEDPRAEHSTLVPVAVWPRQLSKNKIERGCGAIEVIIPGTEILDVQHIDPDSLSWGGVAPFEYYFRDRATPMAPDILDLTCEAERSWSCAHDGQNDIVLHFKIRDIRQNLRSDCEQGCQKVIIDGYLLPQYGSTHIWGGSGLFIK